MTRERDGLHGLLAATARERGPPRDRADMFFRVERRRGKGKAEEGEPEGTESGPLE
jgi:hypothetical protein